MPRLFLLFFWWFCPFFALSQTALETAYQNIEMGATLPDELLASRTAVFLKVPPVASDDANYWKNLGNELHKNLVSLKVDAVAYYQWQDLNSGYDANRSYLDLLQKRDIAQVIILEYHKDQYKLIIVPTHDEVGFLDVEADTWGAKGSQLSQLLEGLSLAVRSRGLELANFLVIETPEFFSDTPIFTNNRFESFQQDLKLDKLAVPVVGKDDPQQLQLPQNQRIQEIMKDYPFQYDFVDYQRGEDLLRQAGFQYILLSLHAPESSVMDLLDYANSPESSSGMVYKFYTRHILSGDIYLGSQWDAAPTREQALINHINNMKRSLNLE